MPVRKGFKSTFLCGKTVFFTLNTSQGMIPTVFDALETISFHLMFKSVPAIRVSPGDIVRIAISLFSLYALLSEMSHPLPCYWKQSFGDASLDRLRKSKVPFHDEGETLRRWEP